MMNDYQIGIEMGWLAHRLESESWGDTSRARLACRQRLTHLLHLIGPDGRVIDQLQDSPHIATQAVLHYRIRDLATPETRKDDTT